MRGTYILGDRQVEVRSVPDPTPGPDEVLVRMRAAAVCGSDLHRYRQPTAVARPPGAAEWIAGHEPCGEVIEIGERVTTVRPGDRVAVYHRIGCGECRLCQEGRMHACPRLIAHSRGRDGADAE